jgi:hypothetical protein
MDKSELSVSETMFKEMILFVDTYRKQQHGHNPLTIPVDSDRSDFVSWNVFEEMFTYYTENSYPLFIPIQPVEGV